MKKKAVLGIDIGATKVKLAPVTNEEKLGRETSFPVPKGVKPRTLAGMIAQHANALDAVFSAAGAGCPGHVANDRRTLLWAPNLRWRKTPFSELLEKHLQVPVALENDVNCAALGEHKYGSGKGFRHIFCIFAGTGIGGGIITDRELLRGATGNAGEVGHILFRPEGRPCSCGRRGCVEAYAAGSQIPLHYAELGGKPGLEASGIWKLAAKGDKKAIRVTSDALSALVTLIVNLQTLFDTERIVLGGGVLEHVPGLYGQIKKRAKAHMTGAWKSKALIVRSKLGANAGILGAAAIAAKLTR